MRLRLESFQRIGRKIHIDDDKGYAVAILLALIIVSSVVIGYYVVFRPQPEGYNTIFLLDSQKKASDYPEVLVANQNSTFNVYVDVENHMEATEQYQVQMKITKNLSTFPVDTQATKVYEISNLENGKSWENMVTITQNEVGSYSVVFELWQKSGQTYEFTHNYCVLNIQVIN
jgi:uncharacterized membrane protein